VYGPDSTFQMPVSVKPFLLPLKVGTIWKYQYYQGGSEYQGKYAQFTG
jgi:hypothetical protein